MLLDSNIFIYCVLPQHDKLRRWVFAQKVYASDITKLEVLGYHHLAEPDKSDLTRLFAMASIYPVSSPVIQQAISLRRHRKMSLGDAIIAATALEYQQKLATKNIRDFIWIDGIELIDPFEK